MLEEVFEETELIKLSEGRGVKSHIENLKRFLEEKESDLKFFKVIDSSNPLFKEINCLILPYADFHVLVSCLDNKFEAWSGNA